jgi:4-diphosphocytidyl-2-C-methyl-D-erythritol kinase
MPKPIDGTGWGQKWPAPAKLNLMLRIVGRRQDGYHLLQTVFQFIDLCDWIVFHEAESDRVRLKNPLLDVPEDQELTVRAARLLKEITGCRKGVLIEIEKNIPIGGGLGGGSSDAATTLLVLNALWQLHLPLSKLMELGLRLGADVPIFIFGQAAWAEGVGEQLQPMALAEPWYLVIKPDCHVNTKEIFLAEELTRNSKSIKIADFIAGEQQNDCLDAVRQRYPLVEDALLELSRYANARLTGTGACIFAQFDSKQAALEAFAAIEKKWQIYVVKGLNESPLFSVLGKL